MKKNFLQDSSYGNVRKPLFGGLSFVIFIVLLVIVIIIFVFARTWISSLFMNLRSMIVITAGEPRFVPRNISEQTLIQSLTAENAELKGILGRRDANETPYTLATVIDRPPRTPYDSILLDIGADHDLSVGDLVVVDNYYVIGSIESVNEKTAFAVLFSSPTQKIDCLLRSVKGTSTVSSAVAVEGRGGGNYYMKLPKNIEVNVGDAVMWPNLSTILLGTVEEVDASEGDAYAQVYFKSPININALRYVQIQKANH